MPPLSASTTSESSCHVGIAHARAAGIATASGAAMLALQVVLLG
jgi:hypothetical protein